MVLEPREEGVSEVGSGVNKLMSLGQLEFKVISNELQPFSGNIIIHLGLCIVIASSSPFPSGGEGLKDTIGI